MELSVKLSQRINLYPIEAKRLVKYLRLVWSRITEIYLRFPFSEIGFELAPSRLES